MKKSLVAASGCQLTSIYVMWDNWYLWEVIEAIELVAELNQDGSEAPDDPIGSWLESMAASKHTKR